MDGMLEFLPDDTYIVGDAVKIRNGDESCYGVVSKDEGGGFYECNFGSKFDNQRGRYPRCGIFSKFSLKLKNPVKG